MTYFSQNFLYFKIKHKHLEKGTLALQVEVIATCFKVYHDKNKKGQKSKIPGAGKGLSATHSSCPGTQSPRTSRSLPDVVKRVTGSGSIQTLIHYSNHFHNAINRDTGSITVLKSFN